MVHSGYPAASAPTLKGATLILIWSRQLTGGDGKQQNRYFNIDYTIPPFIV